MSASMMPSSNDPLDLLLSSYGSLKTAAPAPKPVSELKSESAAVKWERLTNKLLEYSTLDFAIKQMKQYEILL